MSEMRRRRFPSAMRRRKIVAKDVLPREGVAKLGERHVEVEPPVLVHSDYFALEAVPTAKILPYDFDPDVLGHVCESISKGVPYHHSCRLIGAEVKMQRWRSGEFKQYMDLHLARAGSQFVDANLNSIRAAAEKNWTAAAWMLERRYPGEFSLTRGRTTKGVGGQAVQINIVSNIPRPDKIIQARVVKSSELRPPAAQLNEPHVEGLEERNTPAKPHDDPTNPDGGM